MLVNVNENEDENHNGNVLRSFEATKGPSEH